MGQALHLSAGQRLCGKCVQRHSSLYRPFRLVTTSACANKKLPPFSKTSQVKAQPESRGRLLTSRAELRQPSDPAAAHDYFATDKRPVVLFDGVCNLCNGAVDFLLEWDKEAKYRLAALQSQAGRDLLQQAGRRPDDLSSVVLVEPGQAYTKSEAVLRIGRRLNTPFFALGSMGLPVPSIIRDGVYDMVAENRYQVFGKQDSCRKCAQGFDERFIAD